MARPCLFQNRKFKNFVRKVDLPSFSALGLLEFLWACANETGDSIVGTADEVEAATEWNGEPGRVFAALRDTRFIDEVEPGVWEIHDYFDHAPDYVRKRAERETERRAKGKTIRELRSDAGKASAAAKAANKRSTNGNTCSTNGNQLLPGVQQTATSVQQTSTSVRPPAPFQNNSGVPSLFCGSTDPPKPKTAKKSKPEAGPVPRKRDQLFDAIAEVTGTTPSVAGGQIGKACATLKALDPPITPDEVREFGRNAKTLMGWHQGRTDPPTVGEVEKYILRVRANSATTGEDAARIRAKAHAEEIRQAREKRAAELAADSQGDETNGF